MWKPEHRRAAERYGLRYPSNLPDGEWIVQSSKALLKSFVDYEKSKWSQALIDEMIVLSQWPGR